MIEFGNTANCKNIQKRNDVLVSSWQHYQVKNEIEKIICTKSKGTGEIQ